MALTPNRCLCPEVEEEFDKELSQGSMRGGPGLV